MCCSVNNGWYILFGSSLLNIWCIILYVVYVSANKGTFYPLLSIQCGINTTCHVCFQDWEELGPTYIYDLNNLRKFITTTMYMLWFKFISSSNFFNLVHIFQTGSYFSNQFIFFKLVHIYQTGSYFSNWFIFFKLGWNF